MPIRTLSGPLHGGANEQVLELLREIGSVKNVRFSIEKKLAGDEKIMGLGHREYKVKDTRAIILQKLMEELFRHSGASPLYEIALEIERICTPLLGPKGVYPNVDFYSGIVYEKLGIEPDLFTPVFAMARVAGWLAHWIEQLKDNQLFRPTEIYEGPHDVPFTPLDQRP
jgi:citrate synthase